MTTMTKHEAIKAMIKGEHVRHPDFITGETLRMHGDFRVYTIHGEYISQDNFPEFGWIRVSKESGISTPTSSQEPVIPVTDWDTIANHFSSSLTDRSKTHFEHFKNYLKEHYPMGVAEPPNRQQCENLIRKLNEYAKLNDPQYGLPDSEAHIESMTVLIQCELKTN